MGARVLPLLLEGKFRCGLVPAGRELRAGGAGGRIGCPGSAGDEAAGISSEPTPSILYLQEPGAKADPAWPGWGAAAGSTLGENSLPLPGALTLLFLPGPL